MNGFFATPNDWFRAPPGSQTGREGKPPLPARVSGGMSRRLSLRARRRIQRLALFFPIALCAGGFPGTTGLEAQMTPDAPIENFRLPMFGDDGYRIWDLRGDEAIYVSADRIDVHGMRLRVFSGGPEEHVDSLIESPEARVLIDRNEARGENGIRVTGDNHEATGKEWTWERDDNRILIKSNVRVTFDEELEGFLISIP